MIRPTWAEIDLACIRHNLLEIRKHLPPTTRILTAVKADAYGHGAVAVSRVAIEAGASYLGVASVEEGIELRQAGIDVPILVMGYTPMNGAAEVVAWDLTQTIFELDSAQALSQAAQKVGRTVKLHIKVDTGMGRLGVVGADATIQLIWDILELPNVSLEGIFSHMAAADDADKSYANLQLSRWKHVLDRLQEAGINVPLRHISNSAAVIDMPEHSFEMVRVGISLYGFYPSPDVEVGRVQLQPAMQLKSQVVNVKRVPAGEGISYGPTYFTTEEETIATVPIGYADGYSRRHSNSGEVIIHGRRVPVVGRVCMDQLMINVTGVPNVQVGDEVVLYGRQGDESITIDEIASKLGTISYEVVCALGKRVPRVYVNK